MLRSSLLVLLVLVNVSCSRPAIRLAEDQPAAFKLSGYNSVLLFQVSDDHGVIWKLYPKQKDAELNQLGTITYGEIPSCCYQSIPKVGAAPPLVDNAFYSATAVVYDNGPITVRFSMKDGKIREQR